MLQAAQPIDNRPSGSILEGLESFSNWREFSVLRQSASATMIEFLPLPVIGNPNIFRTGISRMVSEIEINPYPDSIKYIENR